MADSLADLQTALDALRKTRASGHRSVRYADREVTYKTDNEMAAAITDIERRIALISGRPVKVVYVTASKGL